MYGWLAIFEAVPEGSGARRERQPGRCSLRPTCDESSVSNLEEIGEGFSELSPNSGGQVRQKTVMNYFMLVSAFLFHIARPRCFKSRRRHCTDCIDMLAWQYANMLL